VGKTLNVRSRCARVAVVSVELGTGVESVSALFYGSFNPTYIANLAVSAANATFIAPHNMDSHAHIITNGKNHHWLNFNQWVLQIPITQGVLI